MITKTYKIARPCNNFSFVLRGKDGNSQRFVFEGGSVMNNVPARLVLRSEYSQNLLEQSKPFKDGDILLERKDDDGARHEEAKNEPTLKPIEEVNDAASAINYVATTWGQKVTSGVQARAYANQQGYDFPNLKSRAAQS